MSLKTVLIADDDKGSRIVIKRLLGKEYNIIEAADGEQALIMLRDLEIDFVILDIVMPKIDGLTVLSEIRKDPKFDSLGVLVASSTYEHTEREALLRGADDVVSKPYDPTVIKKRMENIFAKIELTNHQKTHHSNSDGKISELTTKMINQVDYLLQKASTTEIVVTKELTELKEDILNLKTILSHKEE